MNRFHRKPDITAAFVTLSISKCYENPFGHPPVFTRGHTRGLISSGTVRIFITRIQQVRRDKKSGNWSGQCTLVAVKTRNDIYFSGTKQTSSPKAQQGSR